MRSHASLSAHACSIRPDSTRSLASRPGGQRLRGRGPCTKSPTVPHSPFRPSRRTRSRARRPSDGTGPPALRRSGPTIVDLRSSGHSGRMALALVEALLYRGCVCRYGHRVGGVQGSFKPVWRVPRELHPIGESGDVHQPHPSRRFGHLDITQPLGPHYPLPSILEACGPQWPPVASSWTLFAVTRWPAS